MSQRDTAGQYQRVPFARLAPIVATEPPLQSRRHFVDAAVARVGGGDQVERGIAKTVGAPPASSGTISNRAEGTESKCSRRLAEVIPAEACYLGWQESLTLLAQLVEPKIQE